ncbi:MAG: hypothetical protein IJN92_03975 [Lachnospiraceae bacterium]|nr:hypothetical protein [Lachnospiraceae bacterium]
MTQKQSPKINTEKKLELIRSMRQTHEDNLATINKREAILYGSPISYKSETLSYKSQLSNTNTEANKPYEEDLFPYKKPILTFKVRVFLSIFLVAGYFIFATITENQYTLEKAMVKTYITKDFSNNLFAFMEDFPYTLEYEKISTER